MWVFVDDASSNEHKHYTNLVVSSGDGSNDAVQRLSKFLTFPTLSRIDTIDHIKEGHHEAFDQLVEFLETSYPEVWSTMKVEKVSSWMHLSRIGEV